MILELLNILTPSFLNNSVRSLCTKQNAEMGDTFHIVIAKKQLTGRTILTFSLFFVKHFFEIFDFSENLFKSHFLLFQITRFLQIEYISVNLAAL